MMRTDQQPVASELICQGSFIQELELKDGKDRESCWKIKDKRNEDIVRKPENG